MHSPDEVAVVPLDKRVPLHFDNVSKFSDDRDRGHAAEKLAQQVSSDQSAGSVSAPQKMQLLGGKAGLNATITVREARKLIAQ